MLAHTLTGKLVSGAASGDGGSASFELALDATVSAGHVSFLETGRARPSRELLLRLAEHLEIPLRERNGLLLAAGFAPLYDERPLDSGEMTPVRQGLDRFLQGA